MAHRGKTQHVLLADDQLLFRSGVRTLLAAESDLQIVGEASTVAEMVIKQQETGPDVVVISACLLTAASTDERSRIRDWIEKTALVIIADSTTGIADHLVKAMGSPVVIARSTPPVRIIATIRQAAWREEQEASGMTRTAVGLEALAKAHSTKNSVLTSREQEVVRLLAAGRTVRETAAELSLSAKTIDAHKLNVMRKLDIHNREKLIEYAISQRIVAPAPASRS